MKRRSLKVIGVGGIGGVLLAGLLSGRVDL